MKIGNLNSFFDKTSKVLVVGLAFALPLSTSVFNIFLILFTIAWLFDGKLYPKLQTIINNKNLYAPIMFFGLLLLCATYSTGSNSEIASSLKKMSKILYIPLIATTIDSKLWQNRTLKAYVYAVSILCLSGTSLHLLEKSETIFIFLESNIYKNISWLKPNLMPSAIFKNSIDSAILTAFMIFILLQKSIVNNKFELKYIAFILIGAYFILFVSVGKTGQVIFFLLTLLVFTKKFGKKYTLKALLYLGLFAIAAFVISPQFNSNWKGTVIYYQIATKEINLPGTKKRQNTIGQRFEFAKNSIELIKQKPIIGYGTGSFKHEYKKLAKINDDLIATNPHNEYLNLFVQLGIVGIILFLYWLYIINKPCFRKGHEHVYLIQAISIVVIFGCLLNSLLMDFTSGYLFVLMLSTGLAMGIYKPPKTVDI